MTLLPPLTAQQLHHACDPQQFHFQTTAELEGLAEIIGQMRAMDAVRFGAGIHQDGYNIFVLGPSGMGKRSMVRQFLENKAHAEPTPADWCYINNFAEPHKPLILKLPTGRGAELRIHMERLVDYLRMAIPALFESDEYRAKLAVIQDAFSRQQEQAFQEIGEDADKKNVALIRTPDGFAFAPARDHEVIPQEEYDKLPDDEKKRLTSTIAELQARLEKILRHMPQWRKERSEKIWHLNREIVLSVIEHLINEMRASYTDLPEVLHYLDCVQRDMVEHGDDFRKQEENTPGIPDISAMGHHTFNRYKVNVLVTDGQKHGAPIITEDNPTYTNLIGRVEHISQLGALITDFTLIKPGALHQANGGYLLLDIRKVLLQPFAWEGLKRALQSREIRIESLGQILSLVSTVSLEPEPIPLDVKIILFGDRLFYYLLQQYDPDFGELFKVAADFEDQIDRNPETNMLYARMIGTLCQKEKLSPFDRGAVARVN